MIRYELQCDQEDQFEAWFRNSADYDEQAERGTLECPICGSRSVKKAVMAPAVLRRDRDSAQRRIAMMEEVAAKVRAHVRDNFDYVGERFAEEARRRHEDESEADTVRPIWGETTPDEAKALIEDGVPVAPLPAPFAPTPPRKLN